MNAHPQASNHTLLPSQHELGQELIRGNITPGQFLGLSPQRLYEFATLAHHLLMDGKLQAALDIFKGLVAASPWDSVFHCNLAATYAQLERFPEAMAAYTTALRFNLANVDALVGRSELFLREGKVAEALQDLEGALRLDPQAERESIQRARATLMLLGTMADAAEDGEGSPR
ncbi:tetratricopeptide repeat protein [Corallococcus terminator]